MAFFLMDHLILVKEYIWVENWLQVRESYEI
jgi:hypothetical protein